MISIRETSCEGVGCFGRPKLSFLQGFVRVKFNVTFREPEEPPPAGKRNLFVFQGLSEDILLFVHFFVGECIVAVQGVSRVKIISFDL